MTLRHDRIATRIFVLLGLAVLYAICAGEVRALPMDHPKLQRSQQETECRHLPRSRRWTSRWSWIERGKWAANRWLPRNVPAGAITLPFAKACSLAAVESSPVRKSCPMVRSKRQTSRSVETASIRRCEHSLAQLNFSSALASWLTAAAKRLHHNVPAVNQASTVTPTTM